MHPDLPFFPRRALRRQRIVDGIAGPQAMQHFAESFGSVVGFENVPAGLVRRITSSPIRRTDRNHHLSAMEDHPKHNRIRPP